MPVTHRRAVLAGALAIAVGLTGAACGGEDETASANGLETSRLTLGTMTVADTAPVQLAMEKGLFEAEGLEVKLQTIQGGAEAIPKLKSGALDISFGNFVSLVTASVKDPGFKPRIVAEGFQSGPKTHTLMVRKDSPYHSIEDLKGKKIAVGDAGSGTRAISDAILDAAGIGESDYTPEITDFGASTDMLADKQIDATIFVVGTPVAGLTQLAATTDVKLLGLDDDTTKTIEEGSGAESYDIPADAYDFLDEDVPTVSVFASLVASTDQVSEDTAYNLTKALFEHTDDITLDVGKLITKDSAMLGVGDVPLHPGAQKYFEEEGIELP